MRRGARRDRRLAHDRAGRRWPARDGAAGQGRLDLRARAPWRAASTCCSRRRGACSRPGSPPREGADGHAFLENYEGGWQELFPNCNDPCEYRGVALPFHGEVATVPWSVEPLAGPSGEVAGLRCRVDCRLVPFSLQRVLRLEGDTLVVEQRATNTSAEPWQVVWGHHLVLGAPLVAAGARLELPAAHDRDAAGGVGADGPPRAGAALAVAGRGARAPAARSTSRGSRARRRAATTTSSSPTWTRAACACETTPSAWRSTCAGTRRSSRGWSPGSPTAARRRCRWRAPTRSAWSRGSRPARLRRRCRTGLRWR